MIDKKILKRIDKEALYELCVEYDLEQGVCPETEYEGQSIYEFLLYELGEHLDQLGYTSWEERARIYDDVLNKRKTKAVFDPEEITFWRWQRMGFNK